MCLMKTKQKKRLIFLNYLNYFVFSVFGLRIFEIMKMNDVGTDGLDEGWDYHRFLLVLKDRLFLTSLFENGIWRNSILEEDPHERWDGIEQEKEGIDYEHRL